MEVEMILLRMHGMVCHGRCVDLAWSKIDAMRWFVVNQYPSLPAISSLPAIFALSSSSRHFRLRRPTVTSLCRAPHLDIQTHVGTPKVIAKIFLYETNHNRSNTSRIAAHRSSHKQYTHTMMAMALLSSGGF